SEQRRLRSGIVPRRADRALYVRHRRRLHRAQVRPQPGRPSAARADRERRDPRLPDARRPRRRRHRQRSVGGWTEGVRGGVPEGRGSDRVLGFKTNSRGGGVLERVAIRQIRVGEVAEAIVAADFYYEEGDTGAFTPVLRDIDVRDVTSRRSKHAFLLRG